MNDRTRQGYARLLRDLELLEHPIPLQTALLRAKESIDELERLIARLEKLETNTSDSNSHL